VRRAISLRTGRLFLWRILEDGSQKLEAGNQALKIRLWKFDMGSRIFESIEEQFLWTAAYSLHILRHHAWD